MIWVLCIGALLGLFSGYKLGRSAGYMPTGTTQDIGQRRRNTKMTYKFESDTEINTCATCPLCKRLYWDNWYCALTKIWIGRPPAKADQCPIEAVNN